MNRRICFLLALLPLTLWAAKKEASLHFNLKKCNEADTLIIAKRSLNRGATVLLDMLPARKAKKMNVSLNEASFIIVGIKGDTSACRFIVQPEEKVSVSGKMRQGKALSLHRLSVTGNRQKPTDVQLRKFSSRTLVGNMAEAFEVKTPKGEVKRILPTAHPARYTLIDFWASWCQPCHAEIPNLKTVFKRYHGKGLRMMSISSDQNEEDWRCSLQEVKEPWENYLDHTHKVVGQYAIKFIPAIFVVDEEGRIIADNLRGNELTQFIDTLFK